MHELSICQSIGIIVGKHAAGREVHTIRLRIGKLRQIVPDTLEYCWSLVSEDTTLAGSRLEIESIPAAIKCLQCEQTQTLTEVNFLCPACGCAQVEIVSGDEFLITSLEIAEG